MTLILAARSGDQAAWEELYQKYLGVIYTIAGKTPKSRYVREDVMSRLHEAFVRCVYQYDDSHEVQFICYLWISCCRFAKMAIHVGPISLPRSKKQPLPKVRALLPHDRAFDPHELESMRSEYKKALKTLKKPHRELLERIRSGENIAEIGRDLGVSRQYVHQEYKKAIKTMQTAVGA